MNFDKQLLVRFFLWILCENLTCIIHKIDTEPTLATVIQCQFRDTLTFPYLGIWLNIMHEVDINQRLLRRFNANSVPSSPSGISIKR